MSLYGNVSARPQFIYDKYYPNRKALDEAAATDDVFIGRYVLIDYEFNTDNNYLIDKNANKLIDNLSNDQTVWQKVWKDKQPQYILAARLNAAEPELVLRPLAPGDNKQASIIRRDDDGKNSFIFNWQDLYNLDFSQLDESNDLINIKGFDPTTHSRVNGENYFKWEEVASGQEYWNPETEVLEEAIDTQRLKINLPGLGNAVSDIYDLLLSTNRNAVKEADQQVLDEIVASGDNPLKYIYYNTIDKHFYRVVSTTTESGVAYSFELIETLQEYNNQSVPIESLFQMFLLYYNRYKLLEDLNIDYPQLMSPDQMTKMMNYFDKEYIPPENGDGDNEDEEQEGNFMIGIYNNYNNKNHDITVTLPTSSSQTIYPIIVKVSNDYISGETLTLNDVSTQKYDLYMTNGQLAVTGAFKAGSVVLICFDSSDSKAYIDSAVATWA